MCCCADGAVSEISKQSLISEGLSWIIVVAFFVKDQTITNQVDVILEQIHSILKVITFVQHQAVDPLNLCVKNVVRIILIQHLMLVHEKSSP